MAGGDGVKFPRLGDQIEPAVAQFARRRFQRLLAQDGVVAHIVVSDGEFQLVLARQLGDKGLVGVRGLAPQPMIEVRYKQDDAQLRAQLQQNA